MQLGLGGGRSATASGSPAAGGLVNLVAVDLDGASDYMDCGDSNDLSFGDGSSDSAFSLSMWVFMDATSNFRGMAKSSATTTEYFLGLNTSSQVVFACMDDTLSHQISIRGNTGLSTSTWYNITGTYDGSGSNTGMTLYVNGDTPASTRASAGSYVAMHNSSGALRGGRWEDLGSFGNGKIDEPAVFPSELSAAQVAAIYNDKVAVSLAPFSPTSWWRMGDIVDSTGTDIPDQRVAANDGTLSASGLYTTTF